MQTQLTPEIIDTAAGRDADRILRKCVHCGFCTATCPTYQLLGDELDGPRGRIYLIKQVLEGHSVTRHTQAHLDRCLPVVPVNPPVPQVSTMSICSIMAVIKLNNRLAVPGGNTGSAVCCAIFCPNPNALIPFCVWDSGCGRCYLASLKRIFLSRLKSCPGPNNNMRAA